MKSDIIDIADRRELFVDHFLIDRLDGAGLHLHEPAPADTAITFDAPWEGPGSGYCTVIQDGGRYRLYYRAWDMARPDAPQVTCYAESRDGRGLDNGPEIVGDELGHIVQWADGADIGRYAGTPVRLRAVMRDADLYALRFLENT